MIRSCRITPVLDRICDDFIPSAYLVTMDGELLGSSSTCRMLPSSTYHSSNVPSSSPQPHLPLAQPSSSSLQQQQHDPESFATLVAEIAVDYIRLGDEYSMIFDEQHRHHPHNPYQQQQQQQQQHQYRSHARIGNSAVTMGSDARSGGSTGSIDRLPPPPPCFLFEMDLGTIGVSAILADTGGIGNNSGGLNGYFVVCVAQPDTPLGLIKARIEMLALQVQESISTMRRTNPGTVEAS